MMRYLACVLLLFWSNPLYANPARVQTGEHANFSRVVVNLPTEADWQFGRDDAGYVLRSNLNDGYEITNFFDLIPRDRITDVSQDIDEGELRLGVTCVCYATAVLDRPGILVVDILDGLAPEDALFEKRLDHITEQKGSDSITKSSAGFRRQDNPLLPIIVGHDSSPSVVIRQLHTESPVKKDPIAEQQPSLSIEDAADLVELETAITEGLARALSQGLLETDIVQDEGGTINPLTDRLTDISSPGFLATTGIDQAAIPDTSSIPVTQTGGNCAPDSYFDVASWGDERSFATQIGQARASLTSETGKLKNDAVLNLTRKFIYFGFGREAIQALELDGAQSQERLYLMAMAHIMDNETHDTGLFATQISCASNVALWAFIAIAEQEQDAVANRAQILRAFKSLPAHLQQHLGPNIVERFLIIGDEDAAEQVLAAFRADTAPTLADEAAEVALNRALGDEQTAIKQVARVVETDPRATPDFMISMLADAVRNQDTVDADTFILADAMRFEHADLPIENELAIFQINALLHQENFDAAGRLIHDYVNVFDERTARILDDRFAMKAAVGMRDAAFLTYIIDTPSSRISTAVQHVVASRLLSLGFPKQASRFLTENLENEFSSERSYLRAEAALAMADTVAVAMALQGESSERAADLLKSANSLKSEDGLFSSAYVPDDQTIDQWRRGDWSALASSEDPLLQAVSAAVLDQDAEDLNSAKPLMNGRALLDQSQRSRAVMNDLLRRFEAPAEF